MIITLRRTGQFSRYPRQVAEVEGVLRATAEAIGLDEWSFTVRFKNLSRKDGMSALTTVEWAYRLASLDFDLKQIEGHYGGWDLLEATVRHEVLHIPVWRLVEFAAAVIPKDSPFRELLTAHEEDLVETLCRWPIWEKR